MKKDIDKVFANLPPCAVEYIQLVIKKMRYRKKVRADVQSELIAHFEDALSNCQNTEEKEKIAEELIAEFGDAKILGKLARRAKKRCRPIWRTVVVRIFQTIGVIIIYFVLYCFYLTTGKPAIQVDYTQEYIRANRPKADESLNAGVLYDRMFNVYVEPPKLSNEEKDDKNEYGSGSLLLSRLNDTKRPEELNEEELTALYKWINDNNETIHLFLEASERPYCWWDFKTTSAESEFFLSMKLPNLRMIRDVVKLVSWQGRLEMDKGNFNNAARNIIAIWNSGRHLWGPRTIVEQLVGIAIKAYSFATVRTILTEHDLSKQQLELLQGHLEKMFSNNTLYMNYQTERFMVRDFVQRCYTDNGRGNGHVIPSQLAEFWDIATGDGHIPFSRAAFLGMAAIGVNRKDTVDAFENFYDTAQQYAQITPWQLRQENKTLDSFSNKLSRLKKIRYSNVLWLLPAFDKANMLFHRLKIEGQSLILTFGILRYQLDNNTLPQTLQQLKEAGYVSSIPIDPFSGKEIVYKITDNGFTLYSFGPNFDDDSGVQGKDRRGKIRKWADNGDAVFWPVQ